MSTLIGFSSTARSRRRRSSIAVALAVGLLLAGCAPLGASEESGGVGAPDVGGEPGVVGEAPGDAAGGDRDGDDAGAPSSEREVVVSGSMYLTVETPLEAADEAARIVEAAGGRIDGRREYAPRATARTGAEGGTTTDDGVAYAPDEYPYGYGYGFPGDGGGAVLELRIPADRLTETIERLKSLGELEELQLSSDDITIEVRDIEARITALRSSIERLLALQDTAAAVEDLIALETAISDRQAELESLESQQRYYADQVSLSTLVLTLGSQDVAPIDEPDTFWTGIVTGWEALVGFVGGALVVAGVLLPWLLVLGVLALVAWIIVRRSLRRRGSTTEADESAESAESVDSPASQI